MSVIRTVQGLGHFVRALVLWNFTTELAPAQDALDEAAFRRAGERMAAHPVGRRLLADRPTVDLATLAPDRLRALARGTLGREIWEHMTACGILADLEIPPSRYPLSARDEYAKRRWRETHDFRHVLTGLGVTVHDEVLLHAFQLGQNFNWFGLIVVIGGTLVGCLERSNPLQVMRLLPVAFARGREARFLGNAYYEELLERPLDEVRAMLGVVPVRRRVPASEPGAVHRFGPVGAVGPAAL